MSARRGVSLGSTLACLFAATCAHAGVIVGAGSSLSVGDGMLGFDCADLVVAGSVSGSSGEIFGIANLSVAAGGTLAPGAGRLTLGGDFSDAGTFVAGTSAVRVIDACGSGTTTVSGATAFYDILLDSAAGKRFVFPAGLTQSVAHAFVLQGAAGNLLQITSSVAGKQALFNVSAAAMQSVAYVDARDNKASGATIAPGVAANHQSVDGGDLTNWFANAVVGPGSGAPVPAPLLGRLTTLLLATLLVALAAAQRRAAEWGGDAGKFILMGHSAGAHLVSLIASQPRLANEAGTQPWIGTVALDSAAYDVARILRAPHLPLYDRAFGGDPAYWATVSPLPSLAQKGAPFLAVCSSRRGDSCTQADAYVRKADTLGTRASMLEENLSHAEIDRNLGEPGAYTDAVESFLSTLDPSVARRLRR